MTTWARRGLDMLLAEFPSYGIEKVQGWSTEDAWVQVGLIDEHGASRPYGIWRETGCVYMIDTDGAAADDPFLIPLGSPYLGSGVFEVEGGPIMATTLSEQITTLVERAPSMATIHFAMNALPLLMEANNALAEQSGVIVVQYEGEDDAFTFFHDDGPISVPGSQIAKTYMQARAVIEALRDDRTEDFQNGIEKLAETAFR